MRYNEFIKDPQWPSDAFENHRHFQNSDSQISLYPTVPKKQPNHLTIRPLLEDPSDDQIFYSDEEPEADKENSYIKMQAEEMQEDEDYDSENEAYEPKFEERKKKVEVKVKVKREYERGKYKILDEAMKKQIVEETLHSTIVDVARKYDVSVNNICRWRKRCDRRSGAGRKVSDTEMEGELLRWIHSQSGVISRKTVQKKAIELGKSEGFKASKGWFERFYKRNKLERCRSIQILTSTHYRRRMKKEQKCEQLQETGVKEIESWREECRPISIFDLYEGIKDEQ